MSDHDSAETCVALIAVTSALGEAMREHRKRTCKIPPEHWIHAHDAAVDRLRANRWHGAAKALVAEMLEDAK